MCISRVLEMACACSVFSFAMTVRLLISYLLLIWRSFKDSPKSSATSAELAPESEARGDLADMTRILLEITETLNGLRSSRADDAMYVTQREQENGGNVRRGTDRAEPR